MYQDLKEHAEIEAMEKVYDGVGSPASAMSKQIGGQHYVSHTIQPLHIIDEYGLDFYRGNAIKYILRNKMDVHEDIEKAIHYLQLWLERSSYARD